MYWKLIPWAGRILQRIDCPPDDPARIKIYTANGPCESGRMEVGNTPTNWRAHNSPQVRKPPLKHMPPALRGPPLRKILGRLLARGQIGSPASMHTDACLGYSAMGYQNWKVTHGAHEARKFNLIRLVGQVAKGRDAKGNLTQKAKAGICPRCVQATRIAVPPSFRLGEYSF